MRESPHPFFSRYKTILLLGASIAILTGILFWPAVHYELVNLDDVVYISENRMVQNGLSWSAIRDAFTSIYQVMWAPGLWISYMADIELFGVSPWGAHFTNILLHALNALLAYLLFWHWTRKPWRAFWAAAIWAWHPLRVESVAWLSARKDVLSSLFFLACLLFYCLAHRAPLPESGSPARTWPRRVWDAASLLSLALGLTVKPMLVTTPAVLLLLDAWPLRRVSFRFPEIARTSLRLVAEKWPYWLLVAASAWLAIAAHAQGSSLGSFPLSKRLLTLPLNYAFYLLKTVYPVRLTVLYTDLLFHPIDVLIVSFFLLAITLLVWRYRRQSPAPMIGWLWFLGVMLPASGIIRFGVQSLADRFTYLPALGLSIIALPLFPARRPLSRSIRFVLCAALLLAAAALTRQQLPVWRDSDRLYDQLLRFSPNNAYGLAQRASQLERQGHLQEAEDLMALACKSPSSTDNHQIQLAKIMASQGNAQEARDHLLSVKLLSPGSSGGAYHFALAMVLHQLRDYPEAARHAHLAAEALSPHDLIRNDLNLLGMVIASRMDDPEGALEWARNFPPYRNRDRIEVDDFLPYYLGQWKRFQRLEAVEYFREYLSRHSTHADSLNNLAWLMATAEWSPLPPEEIVAYARMATELSPANPVLLDTLGVALAHAGQFEAAEETAQQALGIVRRAGYERSDLFAAITNHLDAYRNQQPWREENAADRMSQTLYAP